MRNEGDQLFESLDETFDTARRAGCPVVVSHHKCQSKAVWGRSAESLARIEAAAAEQPSASMCTPMSLARLCCWRS
ncbi:MAG: hypothetical protein Ct9H300mP16_16180 [Pseudomonadota bacterium]|nr:MAG: hypothetical protein Ct9H300mP16_16180 [Pseudomonadota bacterium]